MSVTRRCPRCNRELPAAALMGICPTCLGRVVFDIQIEPPPTQDVPGRASASQTENRPGPRVRSFGDYELQSEISRGGMGIVWRARQISLDRPVALKMILAGRLANPREKERFRLEAQAAARLDHPNIVAIYEVGEHEQQPYFSMQLVEGISLGQILQERERQSAAGKQPAPCAWLDCPAASARLIATVARAVHHAHQRGVLHRDLKPGNILVDAGGEPRVTDFGLAKQMDCSLEITQPDTVLGTPHYVSPEQAQGRTDLTTATDIYSLGAMLYHLLTGQPVVQARTAWETLQAVVEREPVRPASLNPRVDGDLETVCLKCLEKDPQRRYSSADALAEDLERWLRGEPILARPSSRWERALKWARRKPLVAGLAGALFFVFVLGLVGIVRYANQANLERAIAKQASLDATEKLWGSYLAQARANRWSGRPGQRFESLAALSNAASIRPTLELRNEAIAAMALPDVRVLRYWQLEPPVPLYAGLVFDAALERYARAYPNGEVAVCQAADDAELLRLPSMGPWNEAALCFSPDGRFLAEKHAGPSTNFFCVWNLEQRSMVVILPGELSQLPFAFSPDSEQVAVTMEAVIHFYELKEGSEIRQFRAPFAPGHLRFAPSGRYLALCIDSRPELVVLDSVSGATVRTFNAGPTGCAWNYRGDLLASTCQDSKVYAWNVPEGRLQATLSGHIAASMTIVGSLTSDLLASSGWDGSTWFWDVTCGEALFSLPGDLIWFSPPRSDDRRLGFRVGNNHAGIWELAPALECRRWPAASVKHATFDLSGHLLITAGAEGVAIWDAEQRCLIERIARGEFNTVLLAPEGGSLFMAGSTGLQRRTFAFDLTSRRVRLGVEENLLAKGVIGATLARDGGTLLAELDQEAGLVLMDPEHPKEARTLDVHAHGTPMAISGDGKRLATGHWHDRNLTIHDLPSGQPAQVLSAAMPARGLFSPNGRYLAVGSSEDYQVFEVASWRRVFRLPRERVVGGYGAIQFSPDSQILAITLNQSGYTRLLEAGSWRELATVEEGYPLCFSADGAKLAMYHEHAKMVMIWDMKLVRQELGLMGLDWADPERPSRASGTSPTGGQN